MPRTAEQNENIRNKRRKKLLVNALRSFATIGFDELTIDDITRTAKCSHGLFYHYYASKEEVYEDVLREFVLPLFEEEGIKNGVARNGLDGLEIFTCFLLEKIKKGGFFGDAIQLGLSLRLSKTYKPSKGFKLPQNDLSDCLKNLLKKSKNNGEISYSEEEAFILLKDLILGTITRFSLNQKEEQILSFETIKAILVR